MIVDFSWITGMSLGIEFMEDKEDMYRYLILDLLIFRIMLIKDMNEA